jgi:hypothetical protein
VILVGEPILAGEMIFAGDVILAGKFLVSTSPFTTDALCSQCHAAYGFDMIKR